MDNLVRSVPVLRVSSAERSCEFYCDKLGFRKDWQHRFAPGLPLFACVSRGPVTLFLTEHPESAIGAQVYFHVEDVDGLCSEFEAQGAIIEQKPRDQPYGMREMQLADPDGNRLRFGQDIEEKKA